MKILVVDDDPAVAEMLRDYLAARTHEVLVARQAREALQLAFHERPDRVILDLGLPDFPGEEVLRAIKKTLPGMRVLILTGRTDDPDLEANLRRLGCDSFLQKGVPLRQIEEALR